MSEAETARNLNGSFLSCPSRRSPDWDPAALPADRDLRYFDPRSLSTGETEATNLLMEKAACPAQSRPLLLAATRTGLTGEALLRADELGATVG